MRISNGYNVSGKITCHLWRNATVAKEQLVILILNPFGGKTPEIVRVVGDHIEGSIDEAEIASNTFYPVFRSGIAINGVEFQTPMIGASMRTESIAATTLFTTIGEPQLSRFVVTMSPTFWH
jgi:hypothetical protein